MKRELKILGLSYSQDQLGSYVIVLSDVKGNRKLPLIIKPNEAQRIAMELEGIKSPRPMIHDVLKTMGDIYGIDVQEIFIHSLLEGVFYTKIITTDGLDEIDIECTAGDAIALSVLYKCPIYTTVDILKVAGVHIADDGTAIDEPENPFEQEELESEEELKNSRIVSISDLEQMMNEAISNEEYEIAAELRDRIEELKKSN
jgi:bifunctional DNase/RNase